MYRDLVLSNTIFKTSAIVALSAILLSGCSSKNDASKANFKSVISDYYASQEEPATCVAGELDNFPYQVPRHYINISDVTLEDKVAAVMDAGLIESVAPQVFDLTESGKSAFIPGSGFCFGTLEVSQVTNFTEPASNGGYTISRVSYTVEVKNRPEWSSSAKLVDTFSLSKDGLKTSGFLSRNDNPEKKNMVLVKTDNGWIAQDDLD